MKNWNEFKFLPKAAEALEKLNTVFGTIVIVTNQQGIGKGLYTENDLSAIHKNMLDEIQQHGGRIDKIYFASALKSENSEHRKPATGMALQALKDFPAIEFNKSVIIGDTITDMQFGKTLGMRTIYIKDKFPDEVEEQFLIDKMYPSLFAFAETL